MKSGSFGKWSLTLGVVLIAALGAGAAARKEKPAVTAAAGSWICPMYCNPATSQPGTCPTCGMALVLASTVPPPPANPERRVRSAAFVCSRGDGTEDIEAGVCAKCGAPMVDAARPLRAAILIFDGVQIVDYCGPYEVLGQGRVEAFTVARSTAPVTTAMGMRVVPSQSFASCPPVDVLIIPGGDVDRVENDAAAIAWLRERAGQAQFVLSVCNGAFILAKTGLLDGLTATTFYDLIDTFASRYPKVRAVRDRRYVDNGKFVTTAGISSGIDGALHVIAKLRGESAAERAALNMEYNWSPATDYARAALADRHLRAIFERNLRLRILDDLAPQLVHTRGDRSKWEAEWRLTSTLPAGELLGRLDRTVAERGRWTRSGQAAAARGDALRHSAWRFEDGGTAWLGVTEVEPEANPHRYRIRVRVTRA